MTKLTVSQKLRPLDRSNVGGATAAEISVYFKAEETI